MSLRHRIGAAVGAASLAMAPVAVSLPAAAADVATQSTQFSFTGAAQIFTVPAGVTSVDVDACGAQGGEHTPVSYPGVDSGVGDAGDGGRATQTISVTPGEQLSINVGGSGASGGWNGGGIGWVNGGGASDVRQGGVTLADRVVVGGGGGGGGLWVFYPQGGQVNGGDGGGLTGAGGFPGTQTGPGVFPGEPARDGALGTGGNGTDEGIGMTSGGGGGLYGGAAGGNGAGEGFEFTGASGGSGLGDSFEVGVCEGHGSVTLTYGTPATPTILPFGVAGLEGDAGSSTWQLPVFLSAASAEVVTVDWATADLPTQPGNAQAGEDFVAASGTVTFAPGQTEAFVALEILGDTAVEVPLLWGEWGVVNFSDPTNATIDTGPFFGAGLFIIFDDD